MIVVMVDKNENISAFIIFFSALPSIQLNYLSLLKLIFILFLVLKRFNFNFANQLLPPAQMKEKLIKHLEFCIICLFIDISFGETENLQFLFLCLTPIFIEISTFPKICTILLYEVLFPMKQLDLAKGTLIFFVLWNTLVGPREFRLCKRAKEIIKIEKLE